MFSQQLNFTHNTIRFPESKITQIGSGKIGDKAQQLLEKTPSLLALDFHVPDRFCLSEHFFAEFTESLSLEKLNSPSERIAKILSAQLPEAILNDLKKIACYFKGHPLVIRSSAEGDCRGTGIFQSNISYNNLPAIEYNVKAVLASSFTESAEEFRKNANIGYGFGEIIEPLIANEFDWFYAPYLSGFAYTSTLKSDGYLSAVSGIGAGVEARDYEKISRAKWEDFAHLMEYVFETATHSINQNTSRSSLLQSMFEVEGIVLFKYSESHEALTAKKYIALGDVSEKIYLGDFLDKLRLIEEVFSAPQYLEWALTFENDTPKFWINQIADINKSDRGVEFNDYGNVIAKCSDVVGTGNFTCHGAFFCFNTEDLEALNEFNKKNKDYLLIFSSRLTTAAMDSLGSLRKLLYSDFSNANVVIEYQDAAHSEHPLEHFKGQVDMSNKAFAVMDQGSEYTDLQSIFDLFSDNGNCNLSTNKTLQVAASEKDDFLYLSF